MAVAPGPSHVLTYIQMKSKVRIELWLPFLPVLIASGRVGVHRLKEYSYVSQRFGALIPPTIDYVYPFRVCNGDWRDRGCACNLRSGQSA